MVSEHCLEYEIRLIDALKFHTFHTFHAACKLHQYNIAIHVLYNVPAVYALPSTTCVQVCEQ